MTLKSLKILAGEEPDGEVYHPAVGKGEAGRWDLGR